MLDLQYALSKYAGGVWSNSQSTAVLGSPKSQILALRNGMQFVLTSVIFQFDSYSKNY